MRLSTYKIAGIFSIIIILYMFIASPTGYLLKAQEADTYYNDKIFNKIYSFTPKHDQIMLRFTSQTQKIEINNLVFQFQLQAVHPLSFKYRFGIYQIPNEMNMEMMLKQLRNSDSISKVTPVMVDQEGFTRYFLPDEFTVQFKKELEENQMLAIIESEGSQVIKKHRTKGYFTISVPNGKTIFQAIRDFIEQPDILFAEPDFFQFESMLFVPDDEYYTEQWNLNNTGTQRDLSTPGADIKIQDTWDISQGNPDVVIAIIDTGMDLDHEDLEENLLYRGDEDWDFSNEEGKDPKYNSQDANYSHGTKVAGVAAAVLNNISIVGVAPKCKIMPLKVNLISDLISQRIDAINYLKEYAKNYTNLRFIANCSWHSGGDQNGLHIAIKEAREAGITFVCASGNRASDKDQVLYPARYLETIAVGASSPCDKRVGKSAEDTCSQHWSAESHYGNELDVMAPGFYIVSTDIENTYTNGPDSLNYFHMTSSAAPHVSGLAGLMLSVSSDLTADNIHRIISISTDKIGNVQYERSAAYGKKNIEYGYGRINAHQALLKTKNHCYIRDPLAHQSGSGHFSGAAVVAMITENLAKASYLSVIEKTQSEIISDFPLSFTGYTSDKMQEILQTYAGPSEGHLNWAVFRKQDVDDILYDLVYWQCHLSFPSVVPIKGNDSKGAYRNWVSIEGSVGNIIAKDSEGNYPITGFFVDDPNEEGGYEKSFKSATTWTDPDENYYLPINGMYEAVIEPPPVSGKASIIPPEIFQGLDINSVEMAQHAINNLDLNLNKRFKQAYEETTAGSPVLVERSDDVEADFYLVPFYKTENKYVSVVVRIKADDGQFMEVAYNNNTLLSMDFPIDPTQPFDPTPLPWNPDFGVSAFHPLHTPKNLIVYPRSLKVELHWNAVISADHYNIYRKGGIYKTGVRQSRYVDYGVENGTEYEYQVTAVSATGEESERTEVMVVIPTRERERR
ncbi:hypothetical protein GMMP15_940044 [Candidatus Magnetomoraceae bacterium gMMP-15]